MALASWRGDPILGAWAIPWKAPTVRWPAPSSAIALVASGGASTVSLGSLHFGEQLIEAATRLALASGVRITPLWSADESGAGLSFEKMPDE